MQEAQQKVVLPATSTDTARAYPGDPQLGVYAHQHGPIFIVYQGFDFSMFASNGGFGTGGSLTLVCDDYPVDDTTLFPNTDELLWLPLLIAARIPAATSCSHDLADYEGSYPPGPPYWTYHIQIDAQVGSSATPTRYETGPLWIVGDTGAGFPPYHG